MEELIGFQMQKTLSCHIANVVWGTDIQMDISKFTYKVEVSIDDAELKSVFKVEEEQYELEVKTTGASIRTITYVGFVRGL